MDIDTLVKYLIPINLGMTIWLTTRQVNINKQNLKLSLYEKRYSIYESTLNFLKAFLLLSLSKKSDDKMAISLVEYKIQVHQSTFLFDDEVEKYLLEILNKASSMSCKIQRNQEYIEDIEWIEKQVVEARNIFKPYLKFKK